MPGPVSYTHLDVYKRQRDLFELLGETRANGGRPVVISDAPDELVSHTRGYGTGSRPEDYLDAFADYVTVSYTHLANSMYQRSELDWLIYNDPLAYVELIFNGEPELYLKVVTEHTLLE